MDFRPAPIRDTVITEVQSIPGGRAHIARVFCQDELPSAELERNFVQTTVQFSPRVATLRGMHLRLASHEEVKLVRYTHGAAFDVVVDLRSGSPSYLQRHGEELRADTYTTVWIPEGSTHGFVMIEPDSRQTLTNNSDPTVSGVTVTNAQ